MIAIFLQEAQQALQTLPVPVPITVPAQSNLALWLAFISLLIPTVLTPIIAVVTGRIAARKVSEVKEDLTHATTQNIDRIVEVKEAVQSNSKANEDRNAAVLGQLADIHALVDGQMSVVKNALAVAQESTVAMLRRFGVKEDDPELQRAVTEAQAARQAANRQAAAVVQAVATGQKITQQE